LLTHRLHVVEVLSIGFYRTDTFSFCPQKLMFVSDS